MFEKEIIGRRLIVILLIVICCVVLQYFNKLDSQIVTLYMAIIALYRDKKEVVKDIKKEINEQLIKQ